MFQSTRPHGARRLVGRLGIPLPGSFNPRARMGRDVITDGLSSPFVLFQSTRPHGARRATVQSMELPYIVSIHAPAWGATLANLQHQIPNQRFNPRARMGRDRVTVNDSVLSSLFQSTRPHGARL